MALAKEGFIVLAPFDVTTTVVTRSALQNKARAVGMTVRAITLWQLAKALDYLMGLSEVDSTHVGVYGISSGGQKAMEIAALESRLSLVIVSGYFTDRFDWSFTRFPPQPAHHINIDSGLPHLFDDLSLVALIQPRFFGIESGQSDPRHRGAVAEFEKVRRLYDHLSYAERTALLSFSGGHETSIATVLPFLRRWLATKE